MTPNVVLSKLAKHQKLTTFFVTDLILIPVHLKEVRKIKNKVLKIRRITKKKKVTFGKEEKKELKQTKKFFTSLVIASSQGTTEIDIIKSSKI